MLISPRMHYLYKAQTKPLFKSRQEKWLRSQSCHCVNINFWHETFSCKCSMCLYWLKSIILFQHKLWYKLISSRMHYLCTSHTKWPIVKSSHFAKNYFCMTPLHAYAQYIFIVYAKYQKASVKVLVQVDFSVLALSKHKQKQTGKHDSWKHG